MRLNRLAEKLRNEGSNFKPLDACEQKHIYEGKTWLVRSLLEYAQELSAFEKPVEELRALTLNSSYPGFVNSPTYLEMAYHMKVASMATFDHPIILGEDGRIMDGHHRVLKALMEGRDTIPAVQFVIDPEPDVIENR